MILAVVSVQVAQADTAVPISVGDSTLELSNIISRGLPVLCVNTVDSMELTCDYVSAPAGCMGKSIANATKVPGRLVIYQLLDGIDSVLYDSGEYEKNVSGMTIKIRGNTSAYGNKKPYKIKLQKKHDLLFRGDEETYKDKEWLLLKYDYLLVMAGFKVNELLGLPWTPSMRFVNVIIDDEYKGVYMLCESVKYNPYCRIKVDKYAGFIFECDPYWWNESVYVNSITAPSYNFTFKYPDDEDITPEQLEYIQGVVTTYENSLSTPDYPNYIDVPSFAAWCLGHDIEGTQDSGGANRYYTKYDTTDTSKIFMPLLWDFDMAEHTSGAWSRSHTSHFEMLFNNPNRTFVDEFVGLWRKVEGTFNNKMSQYLMRFYSSDEGKALDASLEVEGILWDYTYPKVSEHSHGRIGWYVSRVRWMNKKIDAMNPIGDTNIDGTVSIADVTYLIDMLLGTAYYYRYAGDVNGDGNVTVADVTYLIDMLLNSAQ